MDEQDSEAVQAYWLTTVMEDRAESASLPAFLTAPTDEGEAGDE